MNRKVASDLWQMRLLLHYCRSCFTADIVVMQIRDIGDALLHKANFNHNVCLATRQQSSVLSLLNWERLKSGSPLKIFALWFRLFNAVCRPPLYTDYLKLKLLNKTGAEICQKKQNNKTQHQCNCYCLLLLLSVICRRPNVQTVCLNSATTAVDHWTSDHH